MQHSLRLQRRQAIQYSLIARRVQIKRICVVERQQRMEQRAQQHLIDKILFEIPIAFKGSRAAAKLQNTAAKLQ